MLSFCLTIIHANVWHAYRIYFILPCAEKKKVLRLICDNVPSNTYIFSRSLIELETRQYQPPQMPGRLRCSARHCTAVSAAKLSSLVKVSIFLDGARLSLIPEMLFLRRYWFSSFQPFTLSPPVLLPGLTRGEFPLSEYQKFCKTEIALSRLNKSPATLYYAIGPP